LAKPTREDAELLLKLMQTQNTPENNEAMNYFMREFKAPKNYKKFKSKYPPGSQGFDAVSRVLGNFETAGVLVSHGLLNENLYFDISAIGFLWPELAPIVSGWQKEAGANLWENAVWLAERQKWWLKNVWKPGMKWKTAT
jgi:hypothetical protein